MKRFGFVLAVALMVGAAALSVASGAGIKLPKCSKQLCRDVNCAADFYCASGAHVKSCAEICGSR